MRDKDRHGRHKDRNIKLKTKDRFKYALEAVFLFALFGVLNLSEHYFLSLPKSLTFVLQDDIISKKLIVKS